MEDEDKDKDMKSNEDKRTYIGSKRAETREPRGQGQTNSEDRDTWKLRTGTNVQRGQEHVENEDRGKRAIGTRKNGQ